VLVSNGATIAVRNAVALYWLAAGDYGNKQNWHSWLGFAETRTNWSQDRIPCSEWRSK